MGVTQPPAPYAMPDGTIRLPAGAKAMNVQRVAQVVVAVVLAALAVLTVVLFVAGVHKNSQISSLRNNGRTIPAKVTGCLGLLGGSGSNAAGYTCNASFTLAGHRYVDTLPGLGFRRPGAEVSVVVVPSDPQLISTPATLSSEHTSGRVFILPGVLLVLLLAGGALVVIHLRRRTPATTEVDPAS